MRLAVRAGVKRAVIFSPYFLEFERRWPRLRLAEQHYIRSRVEQEKAALAAAGDQMAVSFLLLYIFGSIPSRNPLWKPLVMATVLRLPWVSSGQRRWTR